MKNLNVLLLLLMAISLQAQIISGTIKSKAEQIAVPFAKIGVESEKIGAIADEKGKFSFDLTNVSRDKTVKIEVGGFEIFKTSVAEFIKQSPQTILLNEKVRDIAEVEISPKKLVSKNRGVKTKTKHIMYKVTVNRNQPDDFFETALEFNTDEKAKIEKITLNIARFNVDKPVVLRYNIYSAKNGFPAELLNQADIIATISKDKIVYDVFTIDVQSENIWVWGKFFVSLQFVNDFTGDFKISAAPFKVGFIRHFYQPWEKVKILAPAINIDVKVDKNSKNKVEDVGGTLKILDNLEQIERFTEEAKASKYGKNDEKGKLIHFKDHDSYYEAYGEGEPLFLLHGNNSSIEIFYKQIEEFSKYYKVYAVDTRAQGKSTDFTKGKLTYEQFADDLKGLTDALQLKKINILGWSDGGIVGLLYNLKYPENVNRLAVMGANLFPEGAEKSLVDDTKEKIAILKLMNRPEDFNSIRLKSLIAFQPNIKPKELAKIKNPVLVMTGEKDVIKEEHTRLIQKSIPNSKLLIMKDAGHYAPWEKPEDFNKAILNFLDN